MEEWGVPTLLLLREVFFLNREKYSEIHGALYQCAESLGYECAGFEIVSEAGMDILRLYLEMPGGIDIEDCERVSREVSEYLDTIESDLPERYFLEISSPGLERPLFVIEDYRRFEGKEAQIYLKKGGRTLKGALSGTTPDDEVIITTSEGERRISFDDIKRALCQIRSFSCRSCQVLGAPFHRPAS